MDRHGLAIHHPVIAAAIFAAGDTGAALEWLDAAYRQCHPELVRINTETFYAALRGEPLFPEVLRRIGFNR
jgi:hypothetical protein